jgi:hypothetical protein
MLTKTLSFSLGLLISTSSISATRDNNALYENAIKSYIFAYPLMLMDITKNVTTNVAQPTQANARFQAPVNQFVNVQTFPDANFKDVVRPNADTLYSSAFLDLSKEPMILSVPDTHGRYYLMPMLSGWTDVFASPGKRTTGTHAQNFLIAGPFWKGKKPENMKEIKAPTNLVWILGRTQTNGEADYDAVHEIQKGYKLTPLSAWGTDYKPALAAVNEAINSKEAPSAQVQNMSAVDFFTQFTKLLNNNPLTKEDSAIKGVLKQIGIEPGQDFDASKLSQETIDTLNKAMKEAQKRIAQQVQTSGKKVNGWQFFPVVGVYGTHYLDRAAVAFAGLGANKPEDAIYPTAFVDAKNNPLDGRHKYVVHFSKGKLPPVNGFWSLSMYDQDSFFISNPINRFAIGDRNKLQFNADGSLDIYIQNESPGKEKEANWLPAPTGPFNVTMRLYWPKQVVLDNQWVIPGIQKRSN